jgi:hypothetical protein
MSILNSSVDELTGILRLIDLTQLVLRSAGTTVSAKIPLI